MKKTYVTYMSGEPSYFAGTLALAAMLKKVRSRYPLLVMCSANVGDSQVTYLNSLTGVRAKRNDGGAIPINHRIVDQNKHSGQSKWTNTFAKLRVFGLVDYQKVVFLDSDMMVVENIDHLFDQPHLAAVVADASYPGTNYVELNSGLMVIEPKQGASEQLIKLIPKNTDQPLGDQDIIQRGFPTWREDLSLHLGEEYNVFANHIDFYNRHVFKQAKRTIKVVHFIGAQKPWQDTKIQRIGMVGRRLIRGKIQSLNYYLKYQRLIKKELEKYQLGRGQ